MRDELRHVLHGQRRVNVKKECVTTKPGHRCERRHRIELGDFAQMRQRRHRRVGAEEQRVTVGGGLDHDLGSNLAVRTGAIVGHDTLTQCVVQRLEGPHRHAHRPAAARERNDQSNRAARILRMRRNGESCHERQQQNTVKRVHGLTSRVREIRATFLHNCQCICRFADGQMLRNMMSNRARAKSPHDCTLETAHVGCNNRRALRRMSISIG